MVNASHIDRLVLRLMRCGVDHRTRIHDGHTNQVDALLLLLRKLVALQQKLPSLPANVLSRLRVYTLPGMDRTIVLAMPKHLMTLPGYANIFRRLTEFCRNEYGRNVPAEDVLDLPGMPPVRPARLETGIAAA